MRRLIVLVILMFIVQTGSSEEKLRADGFETLRKNWYNFLTGGTGYNPSDPAYRYKIVSINATAQSYWSSMDTTAARTCIWSDLPGNPNGTGIDARVNDTYTRLLAMATAFRTVGANLYGNITLKNNIISAMDWLNSHWYYTKCAQSGNWWHWRIGIPLDYNDLVVLMYSDLSQIQLDNYLGTLYGVEDRLFGSGGNGAWRARNWAISGILKKDSARLYAVRDFMQDIIFPCVKTKGAEGFYEDGSFIAHGKHPYNGGYGLTALGEPVNMIYLFRGSVYDFTRNRDKVINNACNGLQPFFFRGEMMDMVRGREISRSYSTSIDAGRMIIGTFAVLAQNAPAANAAKLKSMVKEWVQKDISNHGANVGSYGNMYVTELINSFVNDATVFPRGEPDRMDIFPVMDRAVMARDGYSLGISMFSSRIENFECMNRENTKGWYYGAGATYLYFGNQSQYVNDYWATVDPFRIPGVTAEANTSTYSGKVSDKSWVGGVKLLDKYGVAGMELSLNPTLFGMDLSAKKSWFMFDDEIVALGSNITARDNKVVETTIENRKLNSSAREILFVNGKVKPSSLHWTENMKRVNWICLTGKKSDPGIGYLFPGLSNVTGIREKRTGKWTDINTYYNGDSVPRSNNYLTLWLNHGMNPTNSSYAYVLLPNRTVSQVSEYAAHPDIQILENSENIHAVLEKKLNIIGANFWNDRVSLLKVHNSDYLSVDKKASVMVQKTPTELNVAVSDPTQLNTSSITLTIDETTKKLLSSDANVTVLQTSPKTILKVDLNDASRQYEGAKGISYSAKFSF